MILTPSVPSSEVTVIVAASGYPGAPKSGGLIREIEAAEQVPGVTVFHAGTAQSENGLVAKGGRVLAVTAVADTFANARARNVGWRIDYVLVSGSLKSKITAAAIHPKTMGSDHCPVSVTLDL